MKAKLMGGKKWFDGDRKKFRIEFANSLLCITISSSGLCYDLTFEIPTPIFDFACAKARVDQDLMNSNHFRLFFFVLFSSVKS